MSDLVTTHAAMVDQLAKPGEDIRKSLTADKCHILHMAIGISGEAGELLDAIKKYTIYNKEMDFENIVEELGDLEFYLEGLRKALGITRDRTLAHNLNKLLTGRDARYAKGKYSDKQAQDRADKQ